MSDNQIVINDLSKVYDNGFDALKKVSLKVKQGEIIGTLGQSGRATGPHLDIRLNWFGTRLDPATVLNIK